jgi:ATP-dependent protease ClpP protease subunit
MAAYISIVGAKRYIHENSYWMQHNMSDYIWDYLPMIKDRIKYLEKLEDKMQDIMKANTCLKDSDIELMTRGELWLDAAECLKKGIVDEIIPVRQRK